MSTGHICLSCGALLSQAAGNGLCQECSRNLALGAAQLSDSGLEETTAAEPTTLAASDRPPTADEKGARREHEHFGDYELLGEIARGGMGVVFKARHLSLNRIVALKMIRADRLVEDEDIRRFRIEAQAAAQLQHPNIVAIHDVGEFQGQHFYTMDYVAGPSLSQVAREKPLSPKQAARYVQKIAEAIHYAHQRGILHRDLKPSNVLIDEKDEPQVTDFGLAKLMEGDSEMTQSGIVMGSPSFMPPEQASGRSREICIGSDVYSLGAILYDELCGRPPFRAESTIETLRQVVEMEPVLPRVLNPRAPRDLETIVLKCLQKEPAKRYATAQELSAELGRFLRGEPIRARPIHATEKVWRWCKRKPALAVTGATALLAAALGFVGVLWQWRNSEGHRQQAERNAAQAQATVTRLEIERAEMLFGSGQSAEALAYLARVVRRERTNRVAGERILSALAHRSFSVPLFRLEHEAEVTSAEFSPDGQRVLTASKDGTARLWDGHTGQPLLQPLRHAAELTAAHFNQDGSRIVTISLDKTARIWNAQTGQPLTAPLPHDSGVLCADFSPDGRRLVTGSADGSMVFWNAVTGVSLGSTGVLSRPLKFIKFSPDGKWIALASAPGYDGRLVDATNGTIIRAYEGGGSGSVTFPSFTRDGRRLLLSPQGGVLETISLASVSTNRERRLVYNNSVKCAVFSPDGQYVVATAFDSAARIWDAGTLQSVGEGMPHEHWVETIDFSPDGQRLATGGKDHTVRLWQARTGRPLSEPLRHDANVVSVQFSSDSQRILSLCEGRYVWGWQVRSGQPVTAGLQHPYPVRKAVFGPDGGRVATTSWGPRKEDTLVRLWDARKCVLRLPPLRGNGLYDVQFSEDGARLLGVDSEGSATVWDSGTGLPIGGPFSNTGARSARFSPDGQLLVMGGAEPDVKVWHITSGKLLAKFSHGTNAAFARFSPNGQWVVTTSEDKTARLWDWRTGRPLTEPLRHEGDVVWADVSPDSRRVVTLARDQTARIWDANSGALLHRLPHAEEPYHYHSTQFSPDGRLVVVASGNTAQIWNAETGQSVTAPLKHHGRVNSVRFSPDSKRLVTACQDGTARIWDVATDHSLSEPLTHLGRVDYAEFSPDGRWVLTASIDGMARIWEVPILTSSMPAWLADWAEAVGGQQIDERNSKQSIFFDGIRRLRESLERSPAQDETTRWAQWFFAEKITRMISPSSVLSVAQLVERRIDDYTMDSLQQAVQLSPADGAAQARLAFITLTNATTSEPTLVSSLDWQSRHGLELSPNNPDAYEARARFCEYVGKSEEALQAMEQATRLKPTMTNASFWNRKGLMLEKAERLEEALAAYTKAIEFSGPWKDPETLPALGYQNRSRLNRRLNRLAAAASDHLNVLNLNFPKRDPNAPSTLLDLTLFYNDRLDIHISNERNHSFTNLPPGRQTLAGGTEFDIRGVIGLAIGPTDSASFGEVLGIPVAQKCRRLHFLHVSEGQMKADGVEVGVYRILYADGIREQIPIIYGQHLRDHDPGWDPKETLAKNTRVAWEKETAAKTHLRLFETTWENKRPDMMIESLDFISLRAGSGPILFAITAEP